MSKRRQERMSIEIKKILAQILKEQIKDPRIDFTAVSVTRVDVPSDLSHARINISVLGDDAKQTETMKALQNARGFVRKELAQQLQVRHAPEIEFKLDKSIEHGIRINTLLNDLKAEEQNRETNDNQ
ncbi:MAG TPA: 30S ribosome-binding factor RbfA [Syntrophomonadaceae bacterium]|nr:30S ribosome-binding factor RbfA [Syntrophomonadaceae bacterium]